MVSSVNKFLRTFLLFCLLLVLVACHRGPIFSGPSFLNVQSANVLTPAQPSQALTIKNPTRSAVSWSLGLEPSPSNPQSGNWFSANASEGSLAGGASITLTLTLNSGLPIGLYETTATLSYGDKVERFFIVGQVPASTTGSASLSGTVTTDNALIPVLGTPLPPLEPGQENTPEASYVPGQILVKYKETETSPSETLSAQQLNQRQLLSQSLSAEYQLTVLEAGLPGETDLLETTGNVESLARQLSNDPRVDYATPNYYLHALELPNDPQIQEQFALSMVGLPVAWSVETGSSNPVTVAVLDTGFDLNHEDFAGRFLPGYDFCSEFVDVDESEEKTSFVCQNVDADPGFGKTINSHGTHVTGILAANGNNAKGATGVAYSSAVKIVPVKIFADSGVGANLDTFTKGMKWAVGLSIRGVPKNENPARIINLSLGGTFFNEDSDNNPSNDPVNQGAVRFMQDAVNAATSTGALVIAATGNGGDSFILSPAAAENVLAVGSVEQNLTRSSFSSYSAQKLFGPGDVDLMAPGNGILSTFPNSTYGVQQGTSMSAPLVSGVAALLLSREPQLSPEELEQRLLNSVYFDKSMSATEFGKGVIRADLAFGLPGPGNEIALALGGSVLTTTTLDFYGGSSPFILSDLASGTYRFIALGNGAGGQLVSTQEVTLQNAEARTLTVTLKKP